ncbi:site-specific integrase, partial [Bacteroides faecis]|nr:site-specific integrase [Bacteroides faecis]
SNNELNRTLKRIAAICGIERKLVFHKASHSVFSFFLKINSLQNIPV